MWGKVRGARREGGVGKEAKVEDRAEFTICDLRLTIWLPKPATRWRPQITLFAGANRGANRQSGGCPHRLQMPGLVQSWPDWLRLAQAGAGGQPKTQSQPALFQ